MDYFKRENFIILIAVITALLIASNVYLLIPLGDYLIQNYHFSKKELSLCSSVFSICYALGFLFWGILAHKLGNKRVILAGLFILAAVTTLFSLTINRNNFIFFRSLQGIAAASFAPAILSLFSVQLPEQKKIISIGILSSTFLISGIFGQMLSVYFIEKYKLTTLFFVLATAYAVCFILFFLSLPGDKILPENINCLDHFKALPESLMNKRLIPYFLVTLTLLFSFVGLYTALNEILTRASILTAGKMQQIRLSGIAGMLIAPFSSILSQRLGSKKTMSLALLLSITATIMLSHSSSFVILVLGTNLFNCGIALVCPLAVSKIGNLSGKNKNIALSLYTFILFTGAALGSFISIKLSPLLPGANVILFYGFILSGSFFIIQFFTQEQN